MKHHGTQSLTTVITERLHRTHPDRRSATVSRSRSGKWADTSAAGPGGARFIHQQPAGFAMSCSLACHELQPLIIGLLIVMVVYVNG